MHLRSKGHRKKAGFSLKRGRATFLHLPIVVAISVLPKISAGQSAQTAILVPHKMVHGDFADWPTIREDVRFTVGRSTSLNRLRNDQVLVLEDGVEQSSVALQEADQAASICLVLDQSSSMKESGKALIAAAKEIIADANPADEFALVTFDARVYLEQDFTTDAGKLETALQHVGFVGASSLFDAVWVSVDQLGARAPERRKIVVILSDGDNNYSRVPFDMLLQNLRYSGAPLIYSLSPPSHKFGQQQNSQGLPNLQALSKATGGISYESESLGLLKDDAAEISRDIRSRYSLEYTSTHTQRDGKLHKVEIKVKPGASVSKIKTYFRQEYYAPSN
jgi:VWFA-related protein